MRSARSVWSRPRCLETGPHRDGQSFVCLAEFAPRAEESAPLLFAGPPSVELSVEPGVEHFSEDTRRDASSLLQPEPPYLEASLIARTDPKYDQTVSRSSGGFHQFLANRQKHLIVPFKNWCELDLTGVRPCVEVQALC